MCRITPTSTSTRSKNIHISRLLRLSSRQINRIFKCQRSVHWSSSGRRPILTWQGIFTLTTIESYRGDVITVIIVYVVYVRCLDYCNLPIRISSSRRLSRFPNSLWLCLSLPRMLLLIQIKRVITFKKVLVHWMRVWDPSRSLTTNTIDRLRIITTRSSFIVRWYYTLLVFVWGISLLVASTS